MSESQYREIGEPVDLLASASRGAGTDQVGATIINSDLYHGPSTIYEAIATVAGTALDIEIQTSVDGTNWFMIARFAQFAATGRKLIKIPHGGGVMGEKNPAPTPVVGTGASQVIGGVKGKYLRAAYTSTGTWTFQVTARALYEGA